MNDLLREGDLDTGSVEFFLYFTGQVELYCPVIFLLYPGPDHEIDTGVGQFGYRDLRGRVIKDSLIFPA